MSSPVDAPAPDPSVGPRAKTPARSGEPSPAASPDASAPAATPSPAPADPAQPEGEARYERVRRGAVLRPARGAIIGLVEVRRGRIAWLSVGRGPYSYPVHLQVGERLYVGGGGALELSELVGEEAVLRWLRPPAEADLGRPAPAPAADPAGSLRLAEMELYALPEGRVVGVSKVRLGGGPGEDPIPQVTLELFPPGYAQDPTKGYDLFEGSRAGSTHEGSAGRLRLEALTVGRGEERGQVVVRVR
ncbi:MAG: hypothetical protein AB7N76_07795 [Planctomycetota bacterium]